MEKGSKQALKEVGSEWQLCTPDEWPRLELQHLELALPDSLPKGGQNRGW